MVSARRNGLRRARRAVLLGLVAFCAIQACFVATVECFTPMLVDAEYGSRFGKLRTLRRQYPNRKSIVVLGSSRIGNGFETDYATARSFIGECSDSPTVANMSLTGGTCVWQYLMLRRLIDNGLKPDAVVVEILPMTLASDEQYFIRNFHFPAHRMRWSDLRSLAAVMPAESRRHALEWLSGNAVFPIYHHRFSIVGLLAPSWQLDQSAATSQPRVWQKIISPTGWIRFGVDSPTPEQRRVAEDVARKGYGAIGKLQKLGAQTAATYHALFACCRENGIEVAAVVMMPESDMFRGMYGSELQEQVYRFTASLTHDHGIPVVDARDWVSADLFWDGHHLLAKGARVFTDRFCSEVLGFGGGSALPPPENPPTLSRR